MKINESNFDLIEIDAEIGKIKISRSLNVETMAIFFYNISPF